MGEVGGISSRHQAVTLDGDEKDIRNPVAAENPKGAGSGSAYCIERKWAGIMWSHAWGSAELALAGSSGKC
jgi:hypothetical protein